MATSLEKLKELTMDRAKLYSFLSRIFRVEINEKLLGDMKTCTNKQVNINDPEIAEGYAELRNFLEKTEINKEIVDDLAADYASLFLGIGRHPAHPYESVYLSKEKIVMRQPWNDILKIYNAEGLQKVEWFKEPEDHIAIELEFMVYLCLKMRGALDKDNFDEAQRLSNIQNDFLNKHLKAWITKFCDDIVKGAPKHNFYKSIGIIAKRYILLEENTIVKLTEKLRDLTL